MLRRAISQVCRGVVAVHRAISQARGGSLKNYESSAVGESSCPVCNACVPSARWPARRKGRAKRKVRAAGKTQRAGKTQDGRQDARCGQPAKCMRWTRRKVPAAGKMHEVGKTQGAGKTQRAGKTQGAGSRQNAWGGKSAKQREHKTENNRCGKMLGPQSAAREYKKDCPMRQDIV